MRKPVRPLKVTPVLYVSRHSCLLIDEFLPRVKRIYGVEKYSFRTSFITAARATIGRPTSPHRHRAQHYRDPSPSLLVCYIDPVLRRIR